MAWPKLLAEVTVPAGGWAFCWEGGGNLRTATIPADDYETILEMCDALVDEIETLGYVGSTVVVSSDGYVSVEIVGDAGVTERWADCSAALLTLLGFDTSEAWGAAAVTATYRHTRGWYAPVGVDYPALRRRLPRRYQDTEDGYAALFASSQTHTTTTLRWTALTAPQYSDGGEDADGYGATVDWTDRTLWDFWHYTRDRPWRMYLDADSGTVAAPGVRHTDYWPCVRTDEELAPSQLDPASWEWYVVEVPVKVLP